jgi:cyclic beta-1,2-glucan synthetase
VVNGGQTRAVRLTRDAAWALPTLLALLVGTARGADEDAEGRSIPLGAATQQGTFNVGPAQASFQKSLVRDPDFLNERHIEILQLTYTLPKGTAAGIWSKSFPGGLNAQNAEIVHLGIAGTDPDQPQQVSVAMEIKGSAGGLQRIPIPLHQGWTFTEQAVDWPAIGTLTEVVVLVNHTGDVATATGTVDLDIRFERLPWLRKLSTYPAARIAAVFLASILAAALTALLRRLGTRDDRGRRPAAIASRSPGLARDFVRGAGTVFIAVLAIAMFQIGARGPLELGWTAVGMALAGGAIAEWWKFGLTGKHLSAAEVFRDLFATGLLAASASPLAILQTPGHWSDLLLLSQTVAAAAALVYHVVNASRLDATGRHLSAVGGGLIVGTPYVVGNLVVLTSGGLLAALGNGLTLGMLAGWPEVREFVARVFVVFVFNEAVVHGLALATNRKRAGSLRAHLAMLAVALAVVAGPWIAAIGSGDWAAALPSLLRRITALATTIFSQAGLWAEVYLITGLVNDALHGRAPSPGAVSAYPVQGMKKGMVYSGTFMGILHLLGALADVPGLYRLAAGYPVIASLLFGALAFPLVKTIIETFDGSQAFFRRVGASYRNPVLYLRGAVVGFGLGCGIFLSLPEKDMLTRVVFGLGVGVAAYAGVNLVRDGFEASREQGRIQSWRVYLVQALLGGFIGAAIGFYFDAVQVAVVVAKFHRYLSAGMKPDPFGVYPLLSKWGFVNLGDVTGGVNLLFAEALDGVISWSIPAWLFALNRNFMAAYFRKEAAPITSLFTRDGLVQLTENMIAVFRWGLWMSPIIKSFLRPTGDPTWYNQDGAIRTVIATYHDLTMSPTDFRAWSLQLFIYLLAYDWVRMLIWLDHFGLRVATLVNLSFLGMDRLDQRLARFLGPAATARCIPEAVKRFTTWAPLLIPFYIPRGKDWDNAWNQSQALQQQDQGGLIQQFLALPIIEQQLILAGAVVASTAVIATIRWLRNRYGVPAQRTRTLRNPGYEVTLSENGEVASQVSDSGFDVSRRSYDFLDPAGRALFLVDLAENGQPVRAWPVIGNFPEERAEAPRIEQDDETLTIVSNGPGLRSTIEITLPGINEPVERWTITVENLTDAARRVKLVPYLEWVLNKPEADRGHTQYNRLFAEMEYSRALQSVLAWDKHAKAQGFLASDVPPEGFLTARVDFLGRARSLWTSRVLETLAFSEPEDTEAHPTFDPIASLLLGLNVPAHGSSRVRLLIGLVHDRAQAIDLIARHLAIPDARAVVTSRRRKAFHPIGHGAIPDGTPQPYYEFSEEGRKLLVRTPFTTRPFDHTLANARGHVVVVTNRGLHTTSSVNAQQNRVTPDWSDTVTREVPAEAFYLFDPDRGEWYSPTYHPLNDPDARNEAEFGVDGSATFRMARETIETELTVFVPPEEPAGVYLLTVRNQGDVPRTLRLAPYFQMVLAAQPEHAGPLKIRCDRGLNALFFENPRNNFRTGPAFVAMSLTAECMETERGRFFGSGRTIAHPEMVVRGEAGTPRTTDQRPIAAFLANLEIPARGESTVVVVVGQADDRAEAERIIRKYQEADDALASLEETRGWWLSLMETLSVQTTSPEFDRYLDWLKYQALAERIWARRGFYQASGAYGFRDQLQDSVNLMAMDPVLARRQILLHASQQFLEGDVTHWFHLLQDGRTGFVGRTYASDNHLWLAWGVVEYIGATGDETLLDERTRYLESDLPFEPLPGGKHGMGFDPLRSSREDTVYRHVLKAIDLVLDRRLGAHGLPLMGTGDWNDGLDEIGSQGRGESVWLGFFLSYILERMAPIVGTREGRDRQLHYLNRLKDLQDAIERTWRGDRYLRAIHDDGTEIGVKGSGVWEIDALTAAWAVMANINPERGQVVFDTALGILEKETTILLGWPPLREDTKPYLGRSSWYPEGVRENGMYCHGVQWLVGAARLISERLESEGRPDEARRYRETAARLWHKIAAIAHALPGAIETYGGQPNQQAADMVTTFDPGRMIWNGYTGAAGWVFRQALEGVLGMRLAGGELVPPADHAPAGDLSLTRITRDLTRSPLLGPAGLRPPAQQIAAEEPTHPT